LAEWSDLVAETKGTEEEKVPLFSHDSCVDENNQLVLDGVMFQARLGPF